MSAIAGIMMKDVTEEPSEDLLHQLSADLEHRGGDDVGITIQGHVGFVHRRLAILPLQAGHLPITTSDSLMLMSDSRIYYPSIEDLQDKESHKFQTGLDIEVVLPLYEKYGGEFTHHLEGMYAIALYDGYAQELILARDPLGMKPLFCLETKTAFIFASELKVLHKIKDSEESPSRSLDNNARKEVLQTGAILGEKTIYEGIKRINPGETLIIREGAELKRLRPLASRFQPQQKFHGTPRDVCRAALIESFAELDQQEVTFNSFMIKPEDYWLAAELRAVFDHRVHLFWPRVQGVKAVAADFDMGKIEEIPFDERDFWNTMPYIAAELDEPTMNLDTCLKHKLSRNVPRGTSIVFSAVGGECFVGDFPAARKAKRPKIFGGKIFSKQGVFDALRSSSNFVEKWEEELVSIAHIASVTPGLTRLQKAQLIALKTQTIPNHLATEDAVLSSASLEARYPFLHHRAMRALYNLPDKSKVASGQTGVVMYDELRLAFPNLHIPEITQAQRGVMIHWFKEKAIRLSALVSHQRDIERLVDRDTLRAIFSCRDEKHFQAAWSLFSYAMWHQAHVVGVQPVPDTLSFLSQRV